MSKALEVAETLDQRAFTGGGELGALIRGTDWSVTALGPMDAWPEPLKSSLMLCLSAAYPIAIYWGPDLHLFYNDAWRPIVGDKHPWALGRPGHEVWPEIWDVVGPQFQAVLDSKQGTVSRNRPLFLERYGFTEETHFDYSFTPIFDAHGSVAGILNIGMETTSLILSERREKLVRRLTAHAAGAHSVAEVCELAVAALSDGADDVSFAAGYLVDAQRKSLRLVASAGIAAGSPARPSVVDLFSGAGLSPWPFAEVIATGQPVLVDKGLSDLPGLSGGRWPEPPRQAWLLPVRDGETKQLVAIMVVGVSARLLFDELYRDFLDNVAQALFTAVAKVRAYEEEKRMRREAEEARERLALTYEGAGAVGWDMDLATGKITRSGDVKAVYGRAAPDQLFWNLLHPDDRDMLRQAMADAVATKGSFQSEVRILHADGGLRWLASKGKAILGPDGTVQRLAGVNLDITEKRLNQEAMKRQAEQLQKLAAASLALAQAKSIPALLRIATDEAAHIIEAHQVMTITRAAEDSAQTQHARFLSEKYGDWQAFDFVPKDAGLQSAVCRSNKPLRLTPQELEGHPDWTSFGGQTSWYPPLRGWLAAPLIGRDGRNMGLIQLSDKRDGDFTAEDEAVLVQMTQLVSTALENMELIEKIQVVNERLREADRRKDEFLAVVSHELRSPLNVIAGHAQLLRMGVVGSRDFKTSLDAIERSAGTQAQLISDLLDISRIVTGKFVLDVSKFDLVPILESAIESVRFAAESKGVVITRHFDASVGAVVGDATRIQQLVWNLLANAVKFTSGGGFVLISASRRGENIELMISDTGEGIAAEFIPYVFDRFHQEDASKTRKYGGLGLGLAISRYIAELHGGLISVTSDGKGKGAVFNVTLPTRQRMASPVATANDVPPEELIPHSEQGRDLLKGLRILVIDDQEDARDMVAKVYQFLGADVTLAASAAEALMALSKHDFALIVCDIGMPDMNGLQFIRHWRQYERIGGRGPIPAIALTAFAGLEDSKAALEAGFQCHLVKPVKVATLTHIAAELCDRPVSTLNSGSLFAPSQNGG